MIKTEKIFAAMIILTAFGISVVMVGTVFDLGQASGFEIGLFNGDKTSQSIQEGVGELAEGLQDGWHRFRSEGYAFEIEFPQQVAKKSILDQKALNAGLGVSPDTPVWEFIIRDQSLLEGTNLIEASVVVHVLQSQEAVENCSAPKPGSVYQRRAEPGFELSRVDINGVAFWKDRVEEGVMGEFYDRIIYRTVHQGACYEITQLIHARNPGLYEPGTVEAYDQEAVIEQLDQVVETFRILEDIEPTFPEVSYPVPKSVSTFEPKALDDHVYGLDVSHWQGDINWPQVVDAGYKFTFVKATEGVGWLDVKFIENITEATAAGELMGAYHFARPDFDHTAREEAEYFLSQVGDYLETGYIRPVLDLEVGYGMSRAQMTSWVMEWMETVESRSGVEPLIYTNLNFVNNYLTDEVTKYDLWIAYWSCEPVPDFDTPPTGRWSDWAFWQYYGPGGCGSNAGYVPGIETNIDLNIFNGVEAGLGEYDAASPLWVSVTSDSYLAPAPYYADITANVNGDTTGLVNYHFWWNCTALEADVASVEAACGELPAPDAGNCLENGNGMRCLEIDGELQLYEHTYQEIGDYTTKVIVERGDAQPAEDRFKITAYNPLRYTVMDPVSDSDAVINEWFTAKAMVRIRTSVGGPLQVSVVDPLTGETLIQKCDQVGSDAKLDKVFTLSWVESDPGQKTYDVFTRYRPGGSCPITDPDPDDLSQTYTVDWQEPDPVLELERPEGNTIPAGGMDPLGNQVVQDALQLTYTINNPYSQPIQISSIQFENQSNVSSLTADPADGLTIAANRTSSFQISFQVDQIGAFGFDVLAAHDASNSSPYTIAVGGTGVAQPDPLQSLQAFPVSPGEAWIGDLYPLRVEVGVDLRDGGALQTSVHNPSTGALEDTACRTVAGGVQSTEPFDLSWTSDQAGTRDYTVTAAFLEEGSCPIDAGQVIELSQSYQVLWKEDPPVLGLESSTGEALPSGTVVDLGEVGFYSTVSLDYLLKNTSIKSALPVADISAGELINLSSVDVAPASPGDISPSGEEAVQVSFPVEVTGDFSLVLKISHGGSNPSPYTLTITGTGVLESEPIQSLSLDPADPGQPLIGTSFPLDVTVGLDLPADGAVTVQVKNDSTGEVRDQVCRTVEHGLTTTAAFALSWTENSDGETSYRIEADYRAGSGCPVDGEPDDQAVQGYTVVWAEEVPTLEVERPAGNPLVHGSVEALGEFEFYQELTMEYLVRNPSSTTPLHLTDLQIVNKHNISTVDVGTGASLTLQPEEEALIPVHFRVDNLGAFSFMLSMAHDGTNPSPYQITVEGSGTLSESLIQYLSTDPLPPASALINHGFSLNVETGFDLPDQGGLEVQVIEADSGELVDTQCRLIGEPLQSSTAFQFTLQESRTGAVDYLLNARYRARSGCPLGSSSDADRSQIYQVEWKEIAPSLQITDGSGTVLDSGAVDRRGETEVGQSLSRTYLLKNESPTNDLRIDLIQIAEELNISESSLSLAGPITLEPGEERSVTVTYQAGDLGAYAMDLQVYHLGENGSPYGISLSGTAVLETNPIQSITVQPVGEGPVELGEEYRLRSDVVVNAPVPGVLEVGVINVETGEVRHEGCALINQAGEIINTFEFRWLETSRGSVDYQVRARFRVQGTCPLGSTYDAEKAADFSVDWQEPPSSLRVSRPDDVTVDHGYVHNIGTHEFFWFVETTYQLENISSTSSFQVEEIFTENLTNLRRVRIEPSGPFELGPGESQTVKAVFLVLTLEPYSFDLVIYHNGSYNGSFKLFVRGDGRLYLGENDTNPRIVRAINQLIEKRFFFSLPEYIYTMMEGFLEQ